MVYLLLKKVKMYRDELDEIIDRQLNEALSSDAKANILGFATMGLMGLSGYHNYHDHYHHQNNDQVIEYSEDEPEEDETANKYDNTFVGKFINYAENPDSLGFDRENNVWKRPERGKGDRHQFGMGVDDRYYGDSIRYGETSDDDYMTIEDERAMRKKAIDDAYVSYRNRVKYARRLCGDYATKISKAKEAMTLSAIYCKGGKRFANQLFNARNAEIFLHGSDSQWHKVLKQYYADCGVPSRYGRERKFLKNNPID